MLRTGKNKLMFAACSDFGDMRKVNEDSMFAAAEEFGRHRAGLFAVADGCGGMSRGQDASGISIRAIEKLWQDVTGEWDHNFRYCRKFAVNVDAVMEAAVQRAHRAVLCMGERFECDPASTLSVLMIIDDHYWIKHVGDSRIYVLRKNDLMCLTEDQTMLADMLRNGEIDDSEISRYSRSVLSMSIGVKKKLYTYSGHGKVNKKDIFFICSDGMHAYADETDIKDIIRASSDVDNIRNIIPYGSASDNVTFIKVWSL